MTKKIPLTTFIVTVPFSLELKIDARDKLSVTQDMIKEALVYEYGATAGFPTDDWDGKCSVRKA